MPYDAYRVRDAVQFLADSPYYSHFVKRLRAVAQRPRSVPYKGDAEILNELLIVAREANQQAFENLLALAASKRDDRNEYQRKYMAQQRARYRRIWALESALLKRDLTLDERQEAVTRQYAVWNKEKDAFLSAREVDGKLDWHARNAAIRDFWQLKDEELEVLITEASQPEKTVSRKRRLVVVKSEPSTNLGSKLRKALDEQRK
jgi:hypothetical protein